jgi:hypothetical protein
MIIFQFQIGKVFLLSRLKTITRLASALLTNNVGEDLGGQDFYSIFLQFSLIFLLCFKRIENQQGHFKILKGVQLRMAKFCRNIPSRLNRKK